MVEEVSILCKDSLLWKGRREGWKIDGRILFSELKYLRVVYAKRKEPVRENGKCRKLVRRLQER